MKYVAAKVERRRRNQPTLRRAFLKPIRYGDPPELSPHAPNPARYGSFLLHTMRHIAYAQGRGAVMRVERELMRGAGPVAVLRLLEGGERYGYELVKLLDERSDGVLAMGQS